MPERSIEHARASDSISYRSSASSRWFPFAILGFITAIGLTGPLSGVGGDGGVPPLFLTFWLLALGWTWYNLLVRISFEVTLWPDTGRLQFRSVLRRTETSMGAVSGISSTALPWCSTTATASRRCCGRSTE
ncbi:MAG: hypothetical protein Q8M22_05995 [Actinomycetota bacterium]|nr:hypothetical protein [Actinomycetota bacterium]